MLHEKPDTASFVSEHQLVFDSKQNLKTFFSANNEEENDHMLDGLLYYRVSLISIISNQLLLLQGLILGAQ
jgi:hypothetical protein